MESEDFNLDQIINSVVDWASSSSVPHHMIEISDITSTESTPSLELKILPEHLNYAYLSGRESMPVIIASHLIEQQEDSLMSILKRHREAIGWTMKDIKGISPVIVQHRIHLIDEAIPRRDPQCRLNPLMQEAVKTDILKLLDNGIIYAISDSQWVSLVHAVPKKAGFTVVKNE